MSNSQTAKIDYHTGGKWLIHGTKRLVYQMRLACQYLKQTHFLVGIVNSCGTETRDAYLNVICKHKGCAKDVWLTKCIWLASN